MQIWNEQVVQMSINQVSRGMVHYSPGESSEQSVRSEAGGLPGNLKSAAASQHRTFLRVKHPYSAFLWENIIDLLLNVFPLAEAQTFPKYNLIIANTDTSGGGELLWPPLWSNHIDLTSLWGLSLSLKLFVCPLKAEYAESHKNP